MSVSVEIFNHEHIGKDTITFNYNVDTNDVRLTIRNMDNNISRLAMNNINAHSDKEILITLTEESIRHLYGLLR